MDVNSPSMWALSRAPLYRRCRAAIDGGDAVKLLGVEHLPKPGGMSEADYSGYLLRALYFNATQRTHDAFVGMVMGKPAAVETPPALAEIVDNIDGAGTTLETFTRAGVSEVLAVGAGMVVIDHPRRTEGDGIFTAAQARAAKLRPYAAWYPIESVLDYRADKSGVTFVRLLESHEEPDGEWAKKAVPQVRVYDLDGGVVRIRVYRQSGTGFDLTEPEWNPVGPTGQKLTRVPARWFGPVEDVPGKPPFQDLIDVNLAHYRNSADMEHALHFTGLPTPYASGVSPDELKGGLTLGASTGYGFQSENAKIQFATYGADGLGSLRDAMTDKVEMMAALGARMLQADTAAPESGRAMAIRNGGENSALAKLADSVSGSIVWVLERMAEWAGVTGDVAYSLDTDYLPERLGANELTALMGAWQGGGISSEELFDSLKAGGVISDDKDYATHEDEIMSDGRRGQADPLPLG